MTAGAQLRGCEGGQLWGRQKASGSYLVATFVSTWIVGGGLFSRRLMVVASRQVADRSLKLPLK